MAILTTESLPELVDSFRNGNRSYVASQLKEVIKNSTEYDLFVTLRHYADSDTQAIEMLITYAYHL